MPRKFLGGKPTVPTTPVVIETRTLTATDPVTIAGTTSADLSADRTIAVRDANTSGQKGVVSLTDSTSTTSSTLAATATAVKSVADSLSGKVASTRTISTTLPITGGGDLSTDRTLAINNFTGDSGSGGAKGTVPAPAAGDAAAGKFLKADGTWAAPSSSGGSSYVAQFSKAGTVATGTGTFRWYNDSGATRTIGTVRASVGTAPTGSSLIVDVNVSASGAAPATIYSTQANRPTIAASGNTATGSTKSTTTIANGDYFTVDIDQVGSTVAGSDLTVLIWLS